MQQSRVLFALLITLLFTGCSSLTMQVDRNECLFRSIVVGGGLGSIASPLGGVAGSAGGAVLGNFICGDAEPAPAPVMEPEFTGNYIVPDDDNDGVPNHSDACPLTPAGVEVDERGCANDNDGDGVPDYLDKCPNTPLGTPVDETGCSRLLASLQGVHFKFDSATLTGEARSILDNAVAKINAHSSQNIVVEGHTDSTGSDSYNLDLSQRRAESVVNYLTSRGVSASRLRAAGRGENAPVASNDTAAGRSENRRVEIIAR